MRLIASRAASALAVTAAFAMMASPAIARGWGDRGHHRQHRDGVDGGDILAGLLVIGGIAAIASAASNSSKNKQQQEPYRYPGGPDYDSQSSDGSNYGEDRSAPVTDEPGSTDWRLRGSMDSAVDQCVGEVERGDRRVDSVDTVNRAEDGYRVDGRMSDGREFTCTVDRDGRIRQLALDGQAAI